MWKCNTSVTYIIRSQNLRRENLLSMILVEIRESKLFFNLSVYDVTLQVLDSIIFLKQFKQWSYSIRYSKDTLLLFKMFLVCTRYYMWRCMVRQYWFYCPNLVVNYPVVISYPQQCHIGLNVSYWYIIIIAHSFE